MRLHEIADPNDYNLTTIELAHTLGEFERTQPDDSKPCARMLLKTKRTVLPDTT